MNLRIIVELNTDEYNALIHLIDLSVKAKGLQIAETGVVLAKKLTEAKLESEKIHKAAESTDDTK